MTIKEFIEKLQEFDEDCEIELENYNEGTYEYYTPDVETFNYTNKVFIVIKK